MFSAIQLELFFMPILRKFAKLPLKKRDGVFFGKVGFQHPDLLKWTPTMSVFLGITEIIF